MFVLLKNNAVYFTLNMFHINIPVCNGLLFHMTQPTSRSTTKCHRTLIVAGTFVQWRM